MGPLLLCFPRWACYCFNLVGIEELPGKTKIMIVCKALMQVVTLAAYFSSAACEPVGEEELATQHASDNGSCARSTFRVLIDVGHTATSPGANSARGVPEYDFNLSSPT